MLLRLAVNENGSWVRRWAHRTELVQPDDRAAAAALAVLTDRRLVVARAEDVGIAHEALLTGWPRLHGWLEDGRSRAAVRERLAVTTTAWEQADQDPAELYRGTRLQAALDLAAASPEDLTPLEREFLTQSADEADRQLSEQRARADREARGRRRARLVAGVLPSLWPSPPPPAATRSPNSAKPQTGSAHRRCRPAGCARPSRRRLRPLPPARRPSRHPQPIPRDRERPVRNTAARRRGVGAPCALHIRRRRSPSLRMPGRSSP